MMRSPEFAATVVIPTFNRSPVLKWCLEHLEKQPFRDFEVVVVDDGSTDDTAEVVAQYKSQSALEIVFLRQQNSGPAAARNRAVRAARAPVCIFIGDDILCEADFIETHIQFHKARPEIAACGLGLTRWEHEIQKLTPYMRYFEEIQFDYGALLSGKKTDWHHFYTSNLSIKTDLCRRYPFCELFPKAAVEDVELAYRIQQTEHLEVIFLPKAFAFHYHPTTLQQACRRSITIGWSAGLFDEIWPQAGPFIASPLGWRKIAARLLAGSFVRSVLTRALSILEPFYVERRLTGILLDSFLRVGQLQRKLEVEMQSGKPICGVSTSRSRP